MLGAAVAAAAVVAAAAAQLDLANSTVSGEVVVYGATAAGCVAGIAASRAGVKSVVVATPYKHVGGMTTGGIMHADVGNETTTQGIAREFFLRVESHYSPKPSPSPADPPVYGCIHQRCVELDNTVHGTSDPKCHGDCVPLAPSEWLAVSFLSQLSNNNRTLSVTLPKGQSTTYFKKGERLAKTLPPSMIKEVRQGQVFNLTQPAVEMDQTYFLVSLPPPPPPVLLSPDGAPPGWLYESHVAEMVLEQMLAEANVTVVRELVGLSHATKNGTKLVSVTSETGVELRAHTWIDASYEGDLAVWAGAQMVWGRESTEQYNESGAGRQPASIHYPINPLWPDGSVIPHVSDKPLVPVGAADNRIEVYDFRLCFTNSPSNRRPISKPASYNSSEWEFWRRLWQDNPPPTVAKAGLGCLGPIPNNYSDCEGPCQKCDMLGMQHSTDMLNGAWGYPNGTTEERRLIRQAHIDYIQGLLWFMASDPAAGSALHEAMSQVGYCKDEYVDGEPGDPPNWPYQLYVREARRLVGDFVWTEHDPPPALRLRSVGVGSYSFDCHWVSLYADNNSVSAEGRVNNGHDGFPSPGVSQTPYEIPYDVLLPKRTILSNVLVPVACSCSHVRFNAVRMEPTWMIMAQGAGVAAAVASSTSVAVHDVNVTDIQRLLISQNQLIFP